MLCTQHRTAIRRSINQLLHSAHRTVYCVHTGITLALALAYSNNHINHSYTPPPPSPVNWIVIYVGQVIDSTHHTLALTYHLSDSSLHILPINLAFCVCYVGYVSLSM